MEACVHAKNTIYETKLSDIEKLRKEERRNIYISWNKRNKTRMNTNSDRKEDEPNLSTCTMIVFGILFEGRLN
jgi:hypothetical protein